MDTDDFNHETHERARTTKDTKILKPRITLMNGMTPPLRLEGVRGR